MDQSRAFGDDYYLAYRSLYERTQSVNTIITNNGRHIIDKSLVEFYANIDIKHITSLVEHP